MKICFILGTRPEIIKLSPLMRECERLGIEYFMVHTGQHYSYEMDQLFYEQLGLIDPHHNLAIKSASPFLQSEHTGRMLIDIEKILLDKIPDIVMVEGDTNTVLAAAICVNKLRTKPINMAIRLAHVEAGLRSYDRTMTEEINRVLADHMSDFLFAPSAVAKEYMLKEAIDEHKIHITGNSIVDAVYHYRDRAEQSTILKDLGLEKQQYFFATAHRQENVDDPERLRGIIDGLELVSKTFGVPVIYPIHPRTQKMLHEFGISLPSGIRAIDPVGFFESLCLQMNARLILTDSGGVQEEASVLHVPCVTLRDNTERPETVAAGYNILVGTDPKKILAGVKEMLSRTYEWRDLYGDGTAAEKMVAILKGAMHI